MSNQAFIPWLQTLTLDLLRRIATSYIAKQMSIFCGTSSDRPVKYLSARSRGSSAKTSFRPSGSSSLGRGGSRPLSSGWMAVAAERMRLRKEDNAKVTERRVDSPFLLFAPSASGCPLRAAFFALLMAFLEETSEPVVSKFDDQLRMINCNPLLAWRLKTGAESRVVVQCNPYLQKHKKIDCIYACQKLT